MTPSIAASRSLCIIALAIQASVTCAGAQQPSELSQRMTFPPKDEANAAPGFPSFLLRFRKAVDERTVPAVLLMLSPQIRPSPFGDDHLQGREAFRRYLNLDSRQSAFWSVVPRLLEKGGAVDGCDDPKEQCRVTYPIWNGRVPRRFDRLNHLVVQDENVALHETPSSQSRIVERLSYELVKRVIDQTKEPVEGWEHVALLDGQTGFIQEAKLYRFSGFRMTFVRLPDGSWVLGEFVGGD